MLAHILSSVEDVPELWPLVLGVPLPELVAVAEEPLLGPRLLLVASGSANGGIELIFFKRVEQRGCLQLIAACVIAGLLPHPATVDALLHRADDELGAKLRHKGVAIINSLLEIVAGVNVQERERNMARLESFVRKVSYHYRIFATRKKDDRAFKLRSHFAQDVNGLGLEFFKVCNLIHRVSVFVSVVALVSRC